MTLTVSPYAAMRWVACPGSVALEARYPETEVSEDVLAGRASDWAATELLAGAQVAVGQVTPGGTVLDEDMIDGATMYAQEVAKVTGYRVQHRTVVPIAQGGGDLQAVIDSWALNGQYLDIWEYKYGHAYVDVFENWQLISYALALREELGLSDQEGYKVRFHVVQPRSHHRDGPVRHWEISLIGLRSYFNILETAVHRARSPQALCNPAPAQCRDCQGRRACQAITAAAYIGMDDSGTTLPLDLDARATGLELQRLDRALALLEARKTGLEESAMHMIRSKGERVPGFDVAATQGRARWQFADEKIVSIGQMLGLSLAKPVEAVTPAQARKAGMLEELVEQYSYRPTGSPKLIRDDGKAARKAFGPK